MAIAHPAYATPITLGDTSSYGVLVGENGTLSMNGGFNLTGDLGFGENATAGINGDNNSINGDVYQDNDLNVTGDGNVNLSGNVYTQDMQQALSDASTASANAATLQATAGLADQGRSISLNGKSLTIKALTNLSENVLDISSLSLTNGTLTFDDNGFTGAKFIVNITGGFSVKSSGSGKSVFQGIDGASATDVLFNVEGTGSTVSITGSSKNQIIGTILAPNRNVTVGGGGSLAGSLIAGVNNIGNSYSVQAQSSGFNITSFGYKPSAGGSGGGRAPEPSSIALLASGLAAFFVVRRYKRRPKIG